MGLRKIRLPLTWCINYDHPYTIKGKSFAGEDQEVTVGMEASLVDDPFENDPAFDPKGMRMPCDKWASIPIKAVEYVLEVRDGQGWSGMVRSQKMRKPNGFPSHSITIIKRPKNHLRLASCTHGGNTWRAPQASSKLQGFTLGFTVLGVSKNAGEIQTPCSTDVRKQLPDQTNWGTQIQRTNLTKQIICWAFFMFATCRR